MQINLVNARIVNARMVNARTIRLFFLGAILVVSGVQAFSDLPELIPREVLFGNPEKASPKISPDGTRIAYLAPKDGVLNVWIHTIGKEDDRVVTEEKKRDIMHFFWAEDSGHIMYRQDSDGDENWHIYSVDLETNVTRDLTPFIGIKAQSVFTDQDYPAQMLVTLNIRDRTLHDVYRLDLATGGLTLDTKNPGDVADWLVDPEFQVRGAHAMTADGGAELRVRDDVDDPWRRLVKWGPEDNICGALGFTPDGDGFYLSDSRDANTLRLVKIDIDTKEEDVLAADPQYDIDDTIIHPDTHQVQAVSFLADRAVWKVLDPNIEDDIERIRQIHHGDFFPINRDTDDETWLIGFTADDGPVPYYAYNKETGDAEFFFYSRPVLKDYTLASMKPVSIVTRDGLTLHGYLTLPVGIEQTNLPMVLNVHGGPWARDTWGYDPEAQWLANRGYACLQINFRGSTGYGKKFLNAGNREWGAKMHNDLLDAVNWAIEEEIADPERIAIYGGSYGGYAALVGAAFTPDVFACAVDIVGPSNLVTLLQSIPPYWEPVRKLFYERVGNLETEPEFLRSRSPLFKADQIDIPMLIVQGANDPRVKQAESEQIVEALKEKGKDVKYMLFEDEGHGMVRPENRLEFFAEAEEFLAEHLGGRVEK